MTDATLAGLELELPTRLDALSTDEFCDVLHARALAVGEDLYEARAYRVVLPEPPERGAALAFYLRRRAWAEWHFGVETPARQITLLPPEAVDLKVKLAWQIHDELRHHRIFSEEARRRGGHWSLSDFPAPPHLLRMHSEQAKRTTAPEIAAANQFSGEIVLLVTSQGENNVLREVVDERVMAAIEDIETDEPGHIALGRELVARQAELPQARPALFDIQEKFLAALVLQHGAELALLGAERIRPLPGFVAQVAPGQPEGLAPPHTGSRL